jgi:K+-transporting ATPase ATPase A chain
MSPALTAALQIALVVAALALVHVPLGDYIARLLTSPKHNKVESGLTGRCGSSRRRTNGGPPTCCR